MNKNDVTIEKTIVSEGFYLHTFTDCSQKHASTVTVLVQQRAGRDKEPGKRALLIDPSYPPFAEHVKADLQSRGIEPEIILLSHYHPDHAAGCAVFPHCSIYASEHYERNYDNCHVWEPGYTYLRPTHLIRGGDSLSFGDYKFKFHYAPGHSRCSVITEIDGKILHIGDLLMISVNKKDTLPYIAMDGDFGEHIKSLELIKELDPEAIVVPHGGFIDDRNNIRALVDDRVFYLKRVLNSKGGLPLETCLKNDICRYDGLEFHDTNIIRLL